MTAAAPESAPTLRGHVLVVEDFEDTRVLYSEWLAEAGFTVDTAVDGLEAVAIATTAQRRIDAIVMDLQLPNMDGWEAIRCIRTAVTVTPYILVVSAYDGPVSLREAYNAGADAFLGKPLDPRVLVTVIRAALRRMPTSPPPPM